MRKSPYDPKAKPTPEWASMISRLRERLNLSQTDFGHELQTSAMAVSRWERGVHEPLSHSLIQLGNLTGDPDCWFFWGLAGLRSEDLMRVMPELRKRVGLSRVSNFQVVRAGSAGRSVSVKKSNLVAIPLLKISAATHGGKGDSAPLFHDAPVESIIAAPLEWCPNPSTTSCLRVRGDSMNPLIYDGYIIVVDSAETDRAKLTGKIVVVWHKEAGLTVSRLLRFDHTDVLQPENRDYKSIALGKNRWKILGKVLWWIGKAP
jgi:SOS-response transcriptional repressor LexA